MGPPSSNSFNSQSKISRIHGSHSLSLSDRVERGKRVEEDKVRDDEMIRGMIDTFDCDDDDKDDVKGKKRKIDDSAADKDDPLSFLTAQFDVDTEPKQQKTRQNKPSSQKQPSTSLPSSQSIRSIQIIIPQNARRKNQIDHVAKVVSLYGEDLEKLIRVNASVDKNTDGVDCGFVLPLLNEDDDGVARVNERHYYVWRLYSFSQGDTTLKWRCKPFSLFTGSNISILPPPLPQTNANLNTKKQKTSPKKIVTVNSNAHPSLPKKLQKQFKTLLKNLVNGKINREGILSVMHFALVNSAYAWCVVDGLTSLVSSNRSTSKKHKRKKNDNSNSNAVSKSSLVLPCMFVMNDILFNSQTQTVKNCSLYRTYLFDFVPVFLKGVGRLLDNINSNSKLSLSLNSSGGDDKIKDENDEKEKENEGEREVVSKIKKQQIKAEIINVLRLWGRWGVWDLGVIDGWICIVERDVDSDSVVVGGGAECGKEENGKVGDEENIDGEDIDDIDGEDIDGEDIDGEDIDGEDIDGEDM